MHRRILVLALSLLALAPAGAPRAELLPLGGLGAKEWLGKLLFFDQDLSLNRNQSCASCHAPAAGWTGPESSTNATGSVYEGSVPGHFGNRKPPAAAYGGASPLLHYDATAGLWVGGMFWDGRATGQTLGDPLAEQAQGPFLNPLEQALPDAAEVVKRVCASPYGWLMKAVWGRDACAGKTGLDYERIARSIAAYERSKEVSAFTSKYDAYLKGKAQLTAEELSGLQLFEGIGRCAGCHPSAPGPGGVAPLFTDFTYDNLGVPRNPLNPFYYEPSWNPLGPAWIDGGLGDYLKAAGHEPAVYEPERGKFKVPTLRNVDKRVRPKRMAAGEVVKAYGHNGYFKSLKEIVHFYNTRDALPACAPGTPGEKVSCWPAPELDQNVNRVELGMLGLTEVQEEALAAFLKTLSDGWQP